MQWKKHLMLLLTSIFLVGILAACGTAEKKDTGTADNNKGDNKKVLTMGTSADYKPFEFVDTAKSNDIIGMDIDIAKAIGKELGYDIQFKDIDFNSLIPALENGQVDFVASAMNATAERKKTVDFSDSYYSAANVIVTKKGSKIKKPEDLKGKKVGVQLASIQEEYAKDLVKKGTDMKLESRNRIPEIVQELMSGRIDAAIIEDKVAQGYLTDNKELAGTTIKTDEEGGYAIAFPKNSDLTAKFNTELKKMKDNGELDKIIVKWMDTEKAK